MGVIVGIESCNEFVDDFINDGEKVGVVGEPVVDGGEGEVDSDAMLYAVVDEDLLAVAVGFAQETTVTVAVDGMTEAFLGCGDKDADCGTGGIVVKWGGEIDYA